MNESPKARADDTTRLAELIRIKLELLEQIHDLTRQQLESIGRNEMPQLMKLLSVKGRLIKEMQIVERRLDPYRDQDPEDRIWPSSKDRQRCREDAERCETLLKEIVILEKHCESELTEHRNQIAVRLHAAHDALEARRAYSQTSPQPGHMDVSSEG